MFKLVIQDDEGKTTVVPLIRDEITIGRKEGNTIRLTERNVSRRHARILRNNGEVQIEDLGSYNGIRVNNARIAERVSLRVSDQVQIGDYKLYLKAEGVEQVDDARTMPIERVDPNTATDVIASVAAPTTQMPVQTPVPGTLPPAAQIIGTPNRTQVAVADTDPQGRPVASAAAVAAMSTTVGYGKLVVLSSNFAGKEFELSRPQMIIGRTDENDIVVNHRSISRNHAKLVREPDSGRYTISDLQSSNGVRVNGQDYGKVELRRGDVVDLGHVRLRFVEPGEDFLFSRDAVITDVPDAGSKRTLLVAIVLGVIVLGGVVAFIAMRDPGQPAAKINNGNNTLTPADAGDIVAIETPDATEVAIAPVDATTEDKGVALNVQCLAAKDKQQWKELGECADLLKKHDPAQAALHREHAAQEKLAEAQIRALTEAVRTGNIKAAAAAFGKIPSESVYFNDASATFKGAEEKAIADVVTRAKRAISANCREFNRVIAEERKLKGDGVVDRAKVSCKVELAIKDPIKDPTPNKCNAAEFDQKGVTLMGSNQYGPALAAFEAAYKCQPSGETMLRMVLAACRGGNAAKAKTYWKKLTPNQHTRVQAACIGSSVSLDYLNAP